MQGENLSCACSLPRAEVTLATRLIDTGLNHCLRGEHVQVAWSIWPYKVEWGEGKGEDSGDPIVDLTLHI